MSQHTPGPWVVCSGGSNLRTGKYEIDEYFVCRGDYDSAIAADIIDPMTGKPSAANARLIAAAPELLDALEDMAAQHLCGCNHPACKNCERDAVCRSVIAKAKGEQA